MIEEFFFFFLSRCVCMILFFIKEVFFKNEVEIFKEIVLISSRV